MISSVKQAKEIARIYNTLKTDKGRLEYIKDHNDILHVLLGDKVARAAFYLVVVDDEVQEEAIENIKFNDFDCSFGCETSVVDLFEMAGIKAEMSYI